MEQQQQGEVAPSNDNQDSQQPSRSGNDDTWGVGSASALDSLRRQNFRGRRSANVEERPSSD
jgi:hypothetical protein